MTASDPGHPARPSAPTSGVVDRPEVVLAGWKVDDAAAARRREWSLARQLEEEATLSGVLLDLAEQGRVVALTLVGGRARTGRLWGVAPGALGLRARGGRDVVIATIAVVVVRAGPAAESDAPPPVGERRVVAPGSGTFAEAVAGLAVDRPTVHMLDTEGVVAEGHLESVGRDVARLSTATGEVIYVALDGICEVVVTGS